MIKILKFKGIDCKSRGDIDRVFKTGLCKKSEYVEALRQFDEIGSRSFFEQNSERVYKVFSAYEFVNRNINKK